MKKFLNTLILVEAFALLFAVAGLTAGVAQSKPTASERAASLQRNDRSGNPVLTNEQRRTNGTVAGSVALLQTLSTARSQANSDQDRDTGYARALAFLVNELRAVQAGKPSAKSEQIILQNGFDLVTIDYNSGPAERANETAEIVQKVFASVFQIQTAKK